MSIRTILFVDQVGSTRLLADIGDAAMLNVRVRLWQLIRSGVESNAGRVFSDEGDGGAAVFPTAASAARASFQILAGAEHNNVDLRIGLHTGDVIANGNGFVGLAVHIAARLCDEAPSGHIVISTSTADALIDTSLTRTPFGQRGIKGLDDPVSVLLLTDRPVTKDQVAAITRAPEWQPIPSSGLLRRRASQLIGRSREHEALSEAVGTTRTGVAGLALISGNPGAGKSTLLHEFGVARAAAGDLVLLGRSDESFDAPLHDVIEMFTHVIASAPRSLLADHVLRHGDLLTRLLPGLADRVPSASRWQEELGNVALDRALLFEAIGDLVRALARRRPVVLLFEDIHRTSGPTLDLIRHLLRTADLGPVAVVASYRPHEADNDGPLALFLQRMNASPAARSIALESFDIAATEELINLLVPQLVTAPAMVCRKLAEQVFSQTGGNVLFASEVLRWLAPRLDNMTLEEAILDMQVGTLALPDSIADIARGRADRLGEDVALVLTSAAVLGESFVTAELHGMVGDLDAALDALEAAERDGLVRPEDDGGRRFSFGHAIVQRALYTRLTTTERIRAHRRAADLLLHAAPAGRSADTLRHLRAAGTLAQPNEVALQASRAGDEAADRLALREAVNYRQIAVDAIQDDPTATAIDRAHLLAALGNAQAAAGLQIGKSSMVAAADQARRAQAWELFAEIAVDYGGAVKENQAVYAVAEPIALIEEALEHHPTPTAMRSRLLATLTIWRRQWTPYAKRRPAMDESLTIARSIGDPHALAFALASHHRALHGPNVSDEAMDHALELEQLAIRRGDNAMRFQALNVRLLVAFESGDWELAEKTAANLKDVGNLLQHIEGQRLSTMWEIVRLQMRGEFAEAANHLAALKTLLIGYPREDLGRLLAALSFVGFWMTGHAAEMYEKSINLHGRPAALAWYAGDSGQFERTLESFTDSGGVKAASERMDYMWWQDVVGIIRALRLLGDADGALQTYEAILPYRERNATMGLVAFLGSVEHHLGSLACAFGEPRTAVNHFNHALQRHEQLGARPFVALTNAELAGAYRQIGDAEQSAAYEGEARRIANELGLGLITNMLDG